MMLKTTNSGSKTTKPIKTLEGEIWKPFPFKLLKDKLSISNKGRIYSKISGNITKGNIKMGYYYFTIKNKDIVKSYRVHRIVALVFVKNTDKEKNNIVNHIDGNKLNNDYKNLEWTTTQGNNQHSADNELVKKTKRRVAQYDLKGNLIKEFESLTQAYNETGISSGAISDVCNFKNSTAGGFTWDYLDENLNSKIIDLEKDGFKQLKTFPSYWINDKGELYSKKFKKFMKLGKHRNGCLQIQLTKAKKGGGQIKKTVLVHNLVAIYFLKRPKDKKINCIHHKDGDRSNNNVNNLEWHYVAGVSPNFDI